MEPVARTDPLLRYGIVSFQGYVSLSERIILRVGCISIFVLIEKTREIIYRACVNFVFYCGVIFEFLFNLLMLYFFRFVTWSRDVLAPPSSR